jgi:hypothetical protein
VERTKNIKVKASSRKRRTHKERKELKCRNSEKEMKVRNQIIYILCLLHILNIVKGAM